MARREGGAAHTSARTSPARRVLLVGDGELAIAIAATVVEGGGTVERLTAPNDIELREAIERGVSAVAVNAASSTSRTAASSSSATACWGES